MFCEEILLPILEKEKEDKIVDLYFSNIDKSKHPLDNNFFNYKNLHSFENKEFFFSQLFLGKDIDSKYFNLMSIQRITGKNFEPHVDVNRKISAIYTIFGPADTVFYRKENLNLIPVMKIRMELSKWYLFDNSTCHGVFGIQKDRISLVIDLTSIFTDFKTALIYFQNKTI